MSNQKKDSRFLIQGSILAIASIVSRFIGMLYKIPMTNMIGDKGMGYYSSAYELYNIALLISSYSIPVGVSKLVSARLSNDEAKNAHNVFRRSFFIAFVVGIIASLFVFFFSTVWGKITGDMEVARPVKVLAPTIFVFAIMGVFRGYFQGMRTMVPTAVSQLVEQVINAFVSVFASYLLMREHNAAATPESWGAAGGTLGSLSGAVAGFIILIIIYMMNRKAIHKRLREDRSRKSEDFMSFLGVFCITVIPVILSQTVYQASGIVDNTIYARFMDKIGESSKTYFNWGIYSNKYRQLTNLPVAIATALGTSIVPELSAVHAAKNYQSEKDKIAAGIKFNMIIAIPCAIGMCVLAKPIIQLLYPGTEIELSSKALMLGSMAIVFFAYSTITNGILQGIDRMFVPVHNAFVSLVLHVIILLLLLNVFDLGVSGLVIGNITYALTVCIMNAYYVRKHAHYRQEFLTTFLVPLGSACGMGIVTYLVYSGVINILGFRTITNIIAVLLSVMISVVVYLLLMVFLGGVNESELKAFPGGRKVVVIFKRIRLLKN